MDKNDFIDTLKQHFIADLSTNFKPKISDEDFEIVMFVYNNHPLFIGNKYDVARAFAALGMPIFRTLYPIAKLFGDVWDKCYETNHVWLGLVADAQEARKAGLTKLADRLDKKAELAKAADERYTAQYKELLKEYNLEDYIDL